MRLQTSARGTKSNESASILADGCRCRSTSTARSTGVVRGVAEVTVGEEVQLMRENESAYLQLARYIALQPGKIPLELIVVR
jgi:Mannose-6-phosphate isomerase